jgi:hypothetical protein
MTASLFYFGCKQSSLNESWREKLNFASKKVGSQCLYLSVKKCTAIVWQGPAELQIFSDQSFRWGICWNCLELLNQTRFRWVFCPTTSPGYTWGPVGAPCCVFRKKP